MVAYSFMKRFIEPVLTGRKSQTIRGERKRHARAGEVIQIYYGMRTKYCRLIGTARCWSVDPITLDLQIGVIEWRGVHMVAIPALDHFARCDGFAGWQEMRQFWRDYHPGLPVFSGVLIHWRDFSNAETQSVDTRGAQHDAGTADPV